MPTTTRTPPGPNLVHADQTRYPTIESARGIAALMVFISHLTIKGLAPIEKYFDLGKIGVVLFFFISGFLVLPGFAQRPNVKEFVLKRFFRLYPVYWLSIGLALLLHNGTHTTSQVLANTTMFQEFLGFKNLITVYWTLTIEMVFYFSLVFAAIVRPDLLKRELPVSFCITGVMAVVVAIVRHQMQAKLPLALFLALFIMTFGAILRGHLERPLGRRILAFYFLWFCFCTAVSCILGYSFATRFDENPVRYIISYAMGTTFFCVVIFYRRFPTWPVMLVLGQISYGFYLFHSPFLEWFQVSVDSKALAYAMAFVATVLTSWVAYHAIEMPAMRLGRLVLKRQSVHPASATPAVADDESKKN